MATFHDVVTSGAHPKSETTTAVPSENHSHSDMEKESELPTDTHHDTRETQPSTEGKPYTTEVTDEKGTISSEEESEMKPIEKVPSNPLNPNDDEVVYPGGMKLAVICAALCISVLLVALDNTIIATAIPKITDHFRALQDVGWYGSAYLLTTCALQLFFGRLYTFYSIKLVFLISIFIFELGSAVCGAAPTSNALIVGRAIAGVGSAGIFAGALVIIAYSVPLVKRPVYTGLIGSMYGIASIAGPLLGGVFTDKVSWRWCFYINLPLGAVAFVVIIFFFKSPQRAAEQKVTWARRFQQLDVIGTCVFVTAVICCLLALQWGGTKYPWANWRIILLFVLFGLLTITFIVIQKFAGDDATVPFHIIKNRSIAAACFFAVCLGGSFFVMVYWIPIWFQAIEGASPLQSGIRCLPLVLAVTVGNIVSGIGTTAIGYNVPFYYLCVVLSAIGAGLLTTWNVGTGHSEWIGYQVIFGLGIGFGMQQALITVQTILPLRDIPTGTAMSMFFQMFGGALFVSVAQNIFDNQLVKNITKDVPSFSNPGLILNVGATNLKFAIPKALLPKVQVAYNDALTQTWYISVAMSSLSIFGAVLVRWTSLKKATSDQNADRKTAKKGQTEKEKEQESVDV